MQRVITLEVIIRTQFTIEEGMALHTYTELEKRLKNPDMYRIIDHKIVKEEIG